MRALDAEEIAAIQARALVARDFLWVTAASRTPGADPASAGYWNDLRTVTVTVKDGRTGSLESRDFYGVGGAMVIGSVPLTSDVTIRSVEITLPALDDIVALLVRGYDVRGAPMQLYRGYIDTVTRNLVAPPKPRFVGYIDGAPIETAAEGGESSIKLNCVSTTRELTRTSSEVRSYESQIARAATDNFFKDTGVVGDWDMAWGVNRAPLVPRAHK